MATRSSCSISRAMYRRPSRSSTRRWIARRVLLSRTILGTNQFYVHYTYLVLTAGPRFSVLTKGMSAEVHITIRSASLSGPAARAQPIPLEPFSVNKEMGRILIRRGGETIAAGVSCPREVGLSILISILRRNRFEHHQLSRATFSAPRISCMYT